MAAGAKDSTPKNQQSYPRWLITHAVKLRMTNLPKASSFGNKSTHWSAEFLKTDVIGLAIQLVFFQFSADTL